MGPINLNSQGFLGDPDWSNHASATQVAPAPEQKAESSKTQPISGLDSKAQKIASKNISQVTDASSASASLGQKVTDLSSSEELTTDSEELTTDSDEENISSEMDAASDVEVEIEDEFFELDENAFGDAQEFDAAEEDKFEEVLEADADTIAADSKPVEKADENVGFVKGALQAYQAFSDNVDQKFVSLFETTKEDPTIGDKKNNFEDAVEADQAFIDAAEENEFEDAPEANAATIAAAKPNAAKMKKTAAKIGFVKSIFQKIGAFFARIGQGIKSLFVAKKKELTREQKVQKDIVELGVHLAGVKEPTISKMSSFTQNRIVKPLLGRLIANPAVLPHVFDKAKGLLNEKFLGKGTAKATIDNLEKCAVKQLADDLALISDNYPVGLNPKTPAEFAQAEGAIIKNLQAKGKLHKAINPLSADDLALLGERYDIIRRYYPKVKLLEIAEANLERNKSSSSLLSDYTELKEEVNKTNYATQAVIEDLKKRKEDPSTPHAEQLTLAADITKLEKVVAIEDSSFEHEQKYVRNLSKKIYKFIYPNGLKAELPLHLRVVAFMGRAASLDVDELVLTILDNMIINGIDTLSHPGMLYGLVNKEIIVPAIASSQKGTAKPAALSPGELNHDYNYLIAQVARVGSVDTVDKIAGAPAALVAAMGDFPALNAAVGLGRVAVGLGKVLYGFVDPLVNVFTTEIKKDFDSAVEMLPNADTIPNAIQENLNPLKKKIVQKMETSGDQVIDFLLGVADNSMFPNGLRPFKPGLSQEQVKHLKKDLSQNIGTLVNSKTNGWGESVVLTVVDANLDRLNMQVVNKHLIYGLLDKALITLNA